MNTPTEAGGPVPRPGIMSLQALRWYQIAAAAVRFVRANPVAVLVPPLLGSLLLVGGGVLAGWWLLDPGSAIADAAADPAAAQTASTSATGVTSPQEVLFTLVLVALYFIAVPPALGVVLSTLRPAVLGRPRLTLSQAWTTARPHLQALYGVWAVITALSLIPTFIETAAAAPSWGTPDPAGNSDTISTVTGILTLAAVLLLIYVSVLIAFAPAAIIVEGLTTAAALRRSLDLVHRSWWRCFAVLAAISVIILIPTTLITLPTIGFAAAIGIAGPLWAAISLAVVMLTVVFALGSSYSLGATALLYQDQRIRREDYATDLIRDAAPEL